MLEDVMCTQKLKQIKQTRKYLASGQTENKINVTH